jgi:hypothetical protein
VSGQSKLAAKYGVTGTCFRQNPEEQCMLCGASGLSVVGVSAITTIGRGVHKFVRT